MLNESMSCIINVIQRKGFKFQLLFDYSYLYFSAFLLPTSLILTTLAVADAGNNLKSITLCCYAKFCPNKSTIFSSYFLTVVQQIIVYVNLGTRCLNHLLYFQIYYSIQGPRQEKYLGKKRNVSLSLHFTSLLI